ncbi:OmpA family protein [Desulforhopalus sp. 52FAK]
MIKKIVGISFIALCVSAQAMAIDAPKDASPTFSRPATAYSSNTFNEILEAYQLTLDTGMAENLPSSYAKINGDKVSFNNNMIAYSPKQYHAILSAYGLQLTTSDAKEILKTSSYATVSGDTISFGNSSIAYGGQGWQNIMSAYSLPAMADASAMKAAPMKEKAMAGPGDDDMDGVANDKDACPDTPRHAAVDERGCWALSNALLFDFDSAVINDKGVADLNKVVKVFKNHPDLEVTIEGHADSTGAEAYNQALSERRAKAVAKWLVENADVMSSKLDVVGYGEMKPAYPNDTSSSRAKNRRVQFTPAK